MTCMSRSKLTWIGKKLVASDSSVNIPHAVCKYLAVFPPPKDDMTAPIIALEKPHSKRWTL